jgi:hypothetical protein
MKETYLVMIGLEDYGTDSDSKELWGEGGRRQGDGVWEDVKR